MIKSNRAYKKPYISKFRLCAVMCIIACLTAGAAVPSGYYDSLEGLSGVALKRAVKNVARNHTAISYGDATWDVFKTSDTHYVNNQLVWWDMYSADNVAVSSGHPGMNIEHSVANSWWGGTKNDAYKDIFHLNPSNSDANSRKSNYPLGEIATGTWDNGVTFVGKPKSGTCGGASYVYEPADMYKGDFARVFFYMFTIYDDISWKTSSTNWMYDTSSDLLLKPWAYDMLLKWASADPVSEKETNRNEAVYKAQHNRNPFIDLPHLADHIWGSKRNEPFHLDGSSLTDPDDPTPTPTPDPVQPGYWYAVTSSADLNEEDMYVIVFEDGNIMMSTDNANYGKYFLGCSRQVSIDRTASPLCIMSIPDDAAVLTFTRSGSQWIAGVSDVNGNFKGYLKSTEAKSLGLSSSADSGTLMNVTPASDKTRLTFSYSSGSADIQYNANDNGLRFTTYASSSNQQPVRLYRNAKDTEAGMGTGMEENADPVLIGIYDINGRKLNAQSASELDHGIYIVVTTKGVKKILKD